MGASSRPQCACFKASRGQSEAAGRSVFCGRHLCPSTPCDDWQVHQRFGDYREGWRARRSPQSRGTFALEITMIAEFDWFFAVFESGNRIVITLDRLTPY